MTTRSPSTFFAETENPSFAEVNSTSRVLCAALTTSSAAVGAATGVASPAAAGAASPVAGAASPVAPAALAAVAGVAFALTLAPTPFSESTTGRAELFSAATMSLNDVPPFAAAITSPTTIPFFSPSDPASTDLTTTTRSPSTFFAETEKPSVSPLK